MKGDGFSFRLTYFTCNIFFCCCFCHCVGAVLPCRRRLNLPIGSRAGRGNCGAGAFCCFTIIGKASMHFYRPQDFSITILTVYRFTPAFCAASGIGRYFFQNSFIINVFILLILCADYAFFHPGSNKIHRQCRGRGCPLKQPSPL